MENKEEFIDRLCYLYQRWLDEWKYEDINDYLEYMQKLEPNSFAITKRPFGIKVRVDKVIHYFTTKRNGNQIQITESIIEGNT